MRLVIITLLASFGLLHGQVDKNTAAVSSCVGFASAGSDQFTGTLSNWSDVFSTGYLPTTILAGDMVLDASGRWYEVLIINSSNFSGANVTLESKQTPHLAPTGRGLTWRPIGRSLIPPMPFNNGEITIFLRSLIDNHNARQMALIGGGSVDQITTLSDTATVVMPAEGHILIKQDSTLAAFYDGTKWLVLTGGGGGAGGDDWGDQDVVTDGSTLDGDGTPGDPLGVNTTIIASVSYVTGEFDSRIEREVEFEATVSTSTVVLPTQVDTRYPVWVFRGAAFNRSAFSGTDRDWTISGTTATSNYRPLKVGEHITIIYTELQ